MAISSVDRLWVVYPGKIGYPMDEKIACVPLDELSGIRDTVANPRFEIRNPKETRSPRAERA